MKVDYSLYLVTDAALARGRSVLALAAAAIDGGATIVQYREKRATTRAMLEEARALRELCRARGVPFIVNDRLDLALAVQADGLHVGADDLPAAVARRLLGEGYILGVSVGSLEEALRAAEAGADYLGASPIFATPTKADAPAPMGIEGLRALAEGVGLPIIAIGGINLGNAAAVLEAGPAGIAVVSAIFSAEEPESAARALRGLIGDVRRVGS